MLQMQAGCFVGNVISSKSIDTKSPLKSMELVKRVPVAQLDRVAPSEGEGQAFESPQGRHHLWQTT